MSETLATSKDDAAPATPEEETDEQLWADLDAKDREPEPDDDQGDGFDSALKDADEQDGEADEAEPEKTEPEVTEGNPSEDPAPQVERLRHQLQSEKGRTQALTRKADNLSKEIERLNSLLNENKTTAPSKEATAKLAKAREEYGDVIGPIADQMDAYSKRVDRITEVTSSQLDSRRQQLQELYQEQEQVFLKEHPEGHKVVHENFETFKTWIEDQPKDLRDAFTMNKDNIVDGSAAAYVVASFKASLQAAANGAAPAADSKSTLQARRDRQLAGSRSERSGGPSAVTSAPPPDSDDAEAHWKYFETLERKTR